VIGLNKVILLGQVADKPEVRYTPDGAAVACFGLAVTRLAAVSGQRPQRDTQCFSVVAWRELAELCAQDLHPGLWVYVEGRLHNHTWRDALGRPMVRTEVIAERMVVLEREGLGGHEAHYEFDSMWRE
jgi:single-strand DNA-binding protein